MKLAFLFNQRVTTLALNILMSRISNKEIDLLPKNWGLFSGSDRPTNETSSVSQKIFPFFL